MSGSTKKTETPGLWLRLVESFGSTCSFGEVRLAETGLMDKFGISVDSLPRVVAVVGEKGLGREQDNVLPYEGPTDFESLSDFIRDMSRGGVALVQLRREVDEHKREIKGLKVDLEREREAVKTARAEIARSKLGQVGQVEAVKRGLESELQDAREKERTAQVQLQTETHRMEAIIADLEAQREDLASKVKAYEDVQQERVLMLTQNNIDVFLASTTRPLKAVLFTTKSEVPPLWSQLAEAQAMTTAFGVVKHVEDALMERFELDKSDLPRICIWSSEKDEPVVYDGEVKLDALSSFLKDAVHGGDTVIAMRQQVHNAVRQVEDLEAELKRVRLEAAAKEEETERLRAQEAEAHQTQAAQLQAQLQALQQSSESEVSRVSQTARVKLNEAEAKIQTLETELLSERTNMARQMEQLRMQAAADCERERDAWADSRQGEKILEEELTALVKLARRVERTVGRAASAVQVTVVRKDREMERMQRSLREFIDDVAPAQLQAAAYDAAAVRASMPRSHSESSDGIMGAVGVLSQQYKSLKDKINGLDFLGDRMGLDPGPLANVGPSRFVVALTLCALLLSLHTSRALPVLGLECWLMGCR
jgi:DNA repair exonuclease SbcCD ATPase subunit